ncbi:MAG: type II toxin-antitoxin system Phd/YefM family antitoxin [Chloroflexi bacterium]|nr:type II toxin-antitoxin system Phd/YefM family antitoxin [Chloroflexota bacterium]
MRAVGVRELHRNMNRILKEISESGDEVRITSHGRVVARLLPPLRSAGPEEIEAKLARMHGLIERISARVTGPVDVETVMQEERRW